MGAPYQIEMHKFRGRSWKNLRLLYRRSFKELSYLEDMRDSPQPFCYYLLTLRLYLQGDHRDDLMVAERSQVGWPLGSFVRTRKPRPV